MKFQKLCLVIVALVSVTGCSSVAPTAGQEAVLIRKPTILKLFYGHGGVVQQPVTSGRTYIAPTTEVVYINMQPATYHLSIDDMMSGDGVPLDFSSSIRLRVTNSVKMVEQFGPDWYKNNVEQPFFTTIRDAVKKRGMNEVAISASAAEEIDSEVTALMKQYILEKGIPAELNDLNVGKANPPDAVKNQRIATAEQEQRQNTEKQAKLAEDQRKAHEEARADADKAYLLRMGLTPAQFIELKQIETLKQVCAWERGNCTFVNGNTGGTMFTIK